MTPLSTRKIQSLLFALPTFMIAGLALAADGVSPPLVNWPAPATWSHHSVSRGASTMSDIGGPIPLIPVTPCRQYDSRNSTSLPDNTNRAVTLTGAPCGISEFALAVSVNITVFSITGAGGNGVFQVGTANNPTFAWINYPPTETQRGNAGVVPVVSNQIVVKANQGGGSLQFTVDVNGYFPAKGSGPDLNPGESFVLSGNFSGGTVIWGENSASLSGSSGVYGAESATTGAVWGVEGVSVSSSLGAAGVAGLDLSTPLPAGYTGVERAGVLGASQNGVGVLGVCEVGFSDGGVAGVRNFSDGTLASAGYLGYTLSTGVFYNNGLAGTGSKSFIEPHPTDASKVIRYVSIEGPEAGTYFRGKAKLQRGYASIPVPDHFQMVTDPESLSIQVTPIGDTANMAVVRIGLDGILVKGTRDVEFFYLVNGVRRAYNNWDPIQENEKFFVPASANARLPKYLSENERNRLIANGTYNADGTVNLETAARLGWVHIWEEKNRAPSPARAKPASDRGH